MEKRKVLSSGRIFSILCVVAILATIVCQFIPYWEYNGIKTNEETYESRVVDMSTSIAVYSWAPTTEEGDAFEEYVQDPTQYYVENIVEVKVPVEEEVAEETEEAVVEETEEAVAEETEEAVAEDTEETVAEEKEPEYITVNEISIDRVSKDANKITDVDKAIKAYYGEFDNRELVNTLVTAPVSIFLLSIVAFVLSIIFREKSYITGILGFAVGLANVLMYVLQPVFKLGSNWLLFVIISGVVTAIGLVKLLLDFTRTTKKDIA